MKINKYESREEWLAARRGKITGTRLSDIVVKRGNGEKIGFYELIAERLAIKGDDEDPMARGQRLQTEAIAEFVKETGKKVNEDLVLWSREDNTSIALSPDGSIGKTEAVEVKCLGSAKHIEALITKTIPSEYYFQTLQYFIVNDSLRKLHVVFYDPRVLVKSYFILTINRKDVAEDVKNYLEYQKEKLARVDEIVNQLTNF